MGILKANEVIFVDPDAERMLEEAGEIGARSIEGELEAGYIFGTPIVIGAGAPAAWTDTLDEQIEAADEIDEDFGDFQMGREVVIGGGPKAPSFPGFDEPDPFALEPGFDDEFELTDGPSESEQLIERFANFLKPEGSEEGVDLSDLELMGQNTAILRQVDDRVKQLIDEYRGNVASASGDAASFLSGTQRERLLQEALRQVGEKRDLRTLDQVVEHISGRIDSLAAQKQEELLLMVEEERLKTIERVERYVEETVEKYRADIHDEAATYLKSALDEQRRQLESDHELLAAANRIIEDREAILDEAYQKSLTMVQEAEGQVQRIHQEIANAEETARRIFAEADDKANQMRGDAQREAERIISEANLESARIIEQAEQSHQEIIEAATQEGFNVGYQEGREEAVKENAQLLAETTAALNKLHGAFPNAVKNNEEKLVRLAMEIAEAVIGEELQSRPEVALKTVERAVKRVSDLEKVIIKVNPLDLDLILPKQEYFRNLLPDVSEFVITGHYSIARGGCLIETNSGTVDAQISTQLAVLDEVFARVRSEYEEQEE